MTPIIVLTFVGLAGAAIFIGIRLEKKRTDALRQTAAELNFDFFPSGDAALLAGLTDFHLFSQGRSRKVANLMRGATADLDAAVFDYSYVTGGGKHKHTWRQTVARLRVPGGRMPLFSLRPESVWH